jgi:hypothetical protein
VEFELLVRELRVRPTGSLELGLCHGLVARVQCEQKVVGVAHHGRALEIAKPLQALRRLRASLRVVAEADDVVNVLPVEVGEEGVERDRVSVNV